MIVITDSRWLGTNVYPHKDTDVEALKAEFTEKGWNIHGVYECK
jgi:hypothetical protein